MPRKPEANKDLVEEIKDNRAYYVKAWSDIHKQGNLDVRFVAGDPWDSGDVAEREKEEQKRPHLVFDEASQYINGFCGKARQQKRSVKVDKDDGQASKETAQVLQGRIYHIENKSRAQSHYIGALKDAATRGYGFIGVSKKYSRDQGREQEPCIRGFENPDSVLMDPDCKEYDAGDARGCFVDDRMNKRDFKRKYKKFEPKDLNADEQTVVVTTYWRVTTEVTDRFLWLDGGSLGDVEILESKLPGGEYKPEFGEIKDERDIEKNTVTKYLCQLAENMDNQSGDCVEVLEEEETKWTRIPIVPVYGERFYVSTGDALKPKKVYLSLIRRARDPMGLLNFTISQAAETVAMSPKTRFQVYEGQIEGHEDEYRTVGTNPLGVLTSKLTVDPISGQILPHPAPVRWEPPIQALAELVKICQNSIRSAVGQIASPELQKNDSGIAIKRLNDTGDTASFHLIDNFSMSLEAVGQLLGEATLETHDTEREIAILTEAGKQETRIINKVHPGPDGKPAIFDFTKGKYSFTISTGPSHESQADAVREWAQTIAQTDPAMANNLLDVLTEMQNFGPAAQPLLERLKKLLPPQLQDEQDPARMQQGLIQAKQAIAQMQQELQQLKAEKMADTIKTASTERIEGLKLRLQKFKIETDREIALTKVNAQAGSDAAALENEARLTAEDHSLEFDLNQLDHHQGMKQLGAQHAHQAGMQGQQLTAQQQEAEAARNAAGEQAETATV